MDFDLADKPRRRVILLQLAPMIDVFVLIIVFLLKATVLSNVAIIWPSDLKTAKSASTEGVETATQVTVTKDYVEFNMIGKKIPLKEFTRGSENKKEEITASGNDLDRYLKGLQKQAESPFYNVNLVADAGLEYQDLFPVVAFLRSHGFNSILFLAEGEQR